MISSLCRSLVMTNMCYSRKDDSDPPAFWKSSRVELAAPPVHKDRTLLTALNIIKQPKTDEDPKATDHSKSRAWYVLNCHLQAGPQGPRRVRQINEGVRAAMTLARKLKEPKPESMLKLIVCGDFNGGDECGAVRYLEDGFVDETFLEDGEPVSSKRKALPLTQTMTDVAMSAGRSTDKEGVPPTLVVPEFISIMVKEGNGYETPELLSMGRWGVEVNSEPQHEKWAMSTMKTMIQVAGRERE